VTVERKASIDGVLSDSWYAWMARESARLSATAMGNRLPTRVALEALALSNPTVRRSMGYP
jgi:hypothetical protein